VIFHFLVQFARSAAEADGTSGNSAMRYVASPALTASKKCIDAGLADEGAPAAPSQQDCSFRV
jgi:hypothetical protein